MKSLKNLTLLAVLACLAVACIAVKPASAASYRNIYGYVFGSGKGDIEKGDVVSITIYDDTAGGSSDLLTNNTGYDGFAGGLRYYCNHLLTSHEYHIIVVYNWDSYTVRRNFYLPQTPSLNQKVADITYGGS